LSRIARRTLRLFDFQNGIWDTSSAALRAEQFGLEPFDPEFTTEELTAERLKAEC
jgi:hypothetical protein